MEEAVLFIRILIGTLFFSSFIEKVKSFGTHRAIVKDYEILPDQLITPFSKFELALQLLTSMLLYLGIWLPFAAVLAASLLGTYSIAIAINLLRGRNEVSCGCGGFAGNHQLSWWLVVRNITLIAITCFTITTNTVLGSLEAVLRGHAWGDIYNGPYLVTICAVMLLLLTWLSVQRLTAFRNSMNEHLSKGV